MESRPSPPAPSQGHTLAYILLFLTPAMFATNMLTARATAEFIPPVGLAFWRWVGAFLLLLPFCGRALWRGRAALREEAGDLLVLGGLGMGVCGAVVYLGAATTSATNIGLIYAASPVLIVLAARFLFGEAMGGRQIAGVLVALCGVLVVIARGKIETLLGLRFVIGDLYILAAAAGWALYSLLLRHRPSRLEPTARLAAITLGGLVVLAPFLVWESVSVGAPALDWRTLGAIALVAAVPGFGAYRSYGYIQDRLGPGPTGALLYMSPLYTALLGWLLLGEQLHLYHLAGVALVLPGLWLATRAPVTK